MRSKRKTFDAVAFMRKARDKLSRRFSGLSFSEQKKEMHRLANRQANRRTAEKKRTV